MNRIILAAAALLMLPAATQSCDTKEKKSSAPKVKNIILMVGDGMGLAQISAMMIAQDYAPTSLERASTGGFVSTFSANNRVTDSAAAGTAFATGAKTNNGSLGVGPDGKPLESILERAEAADLATGLVATVNIQHATPGAFYAHIENRDDYRAISLDLLRSGVDVAIGGGRKYLTDRPDGRNLVAELEAQGYTMVDSLAALNGAKAPAMALYDDALPTVVEGRDPEYLRQATDTALRMLTASTPREAGGFFLMVEGSQIDWASHANNSEAMLGEIRDFDRAVGTAFDFADAHPGTLVIVLADHETGGLTLPSGNENFRLADSGVETRWSTGGHTGTLVPMFAYGAHADLFGGVMDNIEVNRLMCQLLEL